MQKAGLGRAPTGALIINAAAVQCSQGGEKILETTGIHATAPGIGCAWRFSGSFPRFAGPRHPRRRRLACPTLEVSVAPAPPPTLSPPAKARYYSTVVESAGSFRIPSHPPARKLVLKLLPVLHQIQYISFKIWWRLRDVVLVLMLATVVRGQGR
jgi:hypothetical protein